MCVNFRPSRPEFIRDAFGLEVDFDYRPDIWKGYSAPVILARDERRLVKPAHFGLIPGWCKSWPDAKKLSGGTMNARSETVGQKPSFRDAWQNSRLCLVPMQGFYEPCYETGKAVRTEVRLNGVSDFCVGGIWSWWVDPESHDGIVSFSLLTLNADEHPVLKRLHKPDDEKRSLYVVRPEEYEAWLTASPEEARAMMKLLPEDAYSLSM